MVCMYMNISKVSRLSLFFVDKHRNVRVRICRDSPWLDMTTVKVPQTGLCRHSLYAPSANLSLSNYSKRGMTEDSSALL